MTDKKRWEKVTLEITSEPHADDKIGKVLMPIAVYNALEQQAKLRGQQQEFAALNPQLSFVRKSTLTVTGTAGKTRIKKPPTK